MSAGPNVHNNTHTLYQFGRQIATENAKKRITFRQIVSKLLILILPSLRVGCFFVKYTCYFMRGEETDP